MKRTKYFIIGMLALMIGLSSCEDMLTVDSSRYVTVDENELASPNDSVHSVLGILRQLQNVADRYILLGEVRADLLDVTAYTNASIRELSNFTVSDTNKYANPRDYYAIINNCNYFISRTSAADSPLKRENSLVHAIRAWTYMQVVFNWGKAYYLTDPILSVDDAEEDYPLYTISQVVDALIEDLEPLVNAGYPNYGAIYNFESDQMFFPMQVLLGDLYLWRGSSVGDYERAATLYAEYIDDKTTATDAMFTYPAISWNYDNFINQDFETAYPTNGWTDVTFAYSSNSELISVIQMATIAAEGRISTLPDNFLSFGISKALANLWEDQSYVLHYIPSGGSARDYYTTGDLRKQGNIMGTYSAVDENNNSVSYSVLYKIYEAEHIMVYRLGLVYLRYAEALNRAGKSQTAFAVLKYGLNSITLTDETKISGSELADNSPYITVFNNDKYANIEGIHARGCGDAAYDTLYVIGAVQDTMLRVEELICDEMALETSFEGNRFQDLVRIALRRDDLSFLAERIAAKHEDDYDRIYSLLSSDMNNWFLPEPK